MNFVYFLNTTSAIFSIGIQILSIVLIVSLFSKKLRDSAFVSFFALRSIMIAFIVSGIGTAFSLLYSDVIGYAPCVLCWFQRIALYPQVIIMGLAMHRKDLSVRAYGLILSGIGLLIAVWQYLGQLGFGILPCSAINYSVSCAERFVMQYGYITIPMMALSAFLFILLSFAVSLKKDRDSIVSI